MITFQKLYQQHSERLSLRSSETKCHRDLNIKAFAFLNPCPKLIDVLIWITIKRIPQIPVNTCVRSMIQCAEMTQKSLRERSPPSWIRTNPLLMPHFLGTKATKCANPPHTGDSKSCQYGDKAPLKPHISRGGGGGGGGVGVYFDWCIIYAMRQRARADNLTVCYCYRKIQNGHQFFM